MAVASAFKAAGPVTGAVGFAWSLTNGIDVVPLDSSFAFLTSGLLMLICDACAVRWIGADYNARPTGGGRAGGGAEKAVDRFSSIFKPRARMRASSLALAAAPLAARGAGAVHLLAGERRRGAGGGGGGPSSSI